MSYIHRPGPKKPYQDRHRRYKYPWVRRGFVSAEDRKAFGSEYDQMPFYWQYLKTVLDKRNIFECFASWGPDGALFVKFNTKSSVGYEKHYDSNGRIIKQKNFITIDYPNFLMYLKNSIHYDGDF